MENERIPAECFPVGVFIQEELDARGWTTADLAARMGGDNPAVDQLSVDMLIHVHDINLLMGAEQAEKLGKAFDVSPQFFINLDRSWRQWMWRTGRVVQSSIDAA